MSTMLDPELREALRTFRDKHGRRWRIRLCEMWASGADAGHPPLRRARNVLGPSGLYELRNEDLEVTDGHL